MDKQPFIWTGVGSRKAADDRGLTKYLKAIGFALCSRGGILRSGGAEGADEAFEYGWMSWWYHAAPDQRPSARAEIYLPWKGYNGHSSPLYTSEPDPEALRIASEIHPNWKACTPPARKMHARNIHQVLGQDLKTPSDVVVCWTPDGEKKGGTRTAIICAELHDVPVVNLGGLPYTIMSDKEVIHEIMNKVRDASTT
jgi:hypothetical protein